MASDIPLFFAAFALTLAAAAVALVVVVLPARRRRALAAEARRRRTAPTESDLDSYLARLDQAGSDGDIDRLDKGEG